MCKQCNQVSGAVMETTCTIAGGSLSYNFTQGLCNALHFIFIIIFLFIVQLYSRFINRILLQAQRLFRSDHSIKSRLQNQNNHLSLEDTEAREIYKNLIRKSSFYFGSKSLGTKMLSLSLLDFEF